MNRTQYIITKIVFSLTIPAAIIAAIYFIGSFAFIHFVTLEADTWVVIRFVYLLSVIILLIGLERD